MLYFELAWRNLFRNTRRTLLTCLLISSGLAVLVFADGGIRGMEKLMIGSLTKTLQGEGHINLKGFRQNLDVDLYLKNPSTITDKLNDDERIAAFSVRVLSGGMIGSPYNSVGGLIYGVNAEQEKKVSKIKDAIVAGDYLTGEKRELLIGDEMADLLEVKTGDRIVLTAAEANSNELTQDLFRVKGIFEFGNRELDEEIVFINLADGQALLDMKEGAHQIVLQFKNEATSRDNDFVLLENNPTQDLEWTSWLKLNPSIGAMLEYTSAGTTIIGFILFILISLGVINSLFMSIYERIYEFGVLSAIGTSRREVISLVLLEALFLGIISSLIGLVIGAIANYYFSINGLPLGEMEFSGVMFGNGNLYTELATHQFIFLPLYVILLTLITAIYPALFASRIIPTEALQRAL
jgi:putative ABC transport system permease protein